MYGDLLYHRYKTGGYKAFKVFDSKLRNIHKVSVRDRLLHHGVHRLLYLFFDRTFIYDSYSCHLGKGTHKAIMQFKNHLFKVSKNNARQCWVLKCDIKKFFVSIDYKILVDILKEYISDKETIKLLENIINSFHTENSYGTSLPLGNLTS